MHSTLVSPQKNFEMDSAVREAVADAHNAMAEEYDLVDDLWYSWLFFEIHEFIALHLPKGKGLPAIDVGCGTGFQSFLLAVAGYKVDAFDIAQGLIDIAVQKAAKVSTESFADLVSGIGMYGISEKQRDTFRTLLNQLNCNNVVYQPRFYVADALNSSKFTG